MDRATQKLPLRLIPDKGSQLKEFIFPLVLIGFAVFLFRQVDPLNVIDVHGKPVYLTFLFFAVFLLFPLSMIASSVLKLLPGSPYYYLQIASEGLTLRQGRKTKRYLWTELSPFAVDVQVTSTRNSKTGSGQTETDYYVVAGRAGDDAAPQDDRYPVFRIPTDEYGVGGGKEDANAFANWLNEIRASALANSGLAPADVAVPLEYCEIVRSAPAAAQTTPMFAKKSSRVIER